MNFGIIIVIALLGIWALGIFFGVIGGLTKSFTHTPAPVDSSDIKAQEQQTIQDTEEKREQLMEDMKQKMQDAQQQQKF